MIKRIETTLIYFLSLIAKLDIIIFMLFLVSFIFIVI